MITNQTSTMSQTTIDRLTQKLIRDIESHPHKVELLALAVDQLLDMDSLLEPG